MKSTVILLVIAALLVGTVAGASALYKNWGEEYSQSNGNVGGLDVLDTVGTNTPLSPDSTSGVSTSIPATNDMIAATTVSTNVKNVVSNVTTTVATEKSASPTASVPKQEEPKVTLSVPDFEVLDYNGNKVRLSDFAGKPIVINFWATWCYYCKAEMPDFDKAYEEYPDVVFLMVNDTDGASETVATAKAFVESAGYDFNVYFDTTGEAFGAYGVTSYPSTYFINAKGELVARRIGMIDYSILEQGIAYITG